MNRIRLNSRAAQVFIVGSISILLVTGLVSLHGQVLRGTPEQPDGHEFYLARIAYQTSRRAGSRPGIWNPMWAVDYPFGELHFQPALSRMTMISVADVTGEEQYFFELDDDRIFQYPFLWMQQPGSGGWRPTPDEAAQLREYLLRGGFMFVDDFHGDYEFAAFASSMARVLPDREIVAIPPDDPLMHIFFELTPGTPIPGARHVWSGRGGQSDIRMAGPSRLLGIYDDDGRLMVGINFNMDMGDAWEHADDPGYPADMTVEAYRIGVNYVLYAMTH
jgi:hypothetical protein